MCDAAVRRGVFCSILQQHAAGPQSQQLTPFAVPASTTHITDFERPPAEIRNCFVNTNNAAFDSIGLCRIGGKCGWNERSKAVWERLALLDITAIGVRQPSF